MTQIEALKLALEALENLPEMCGIEEAITAVQEALAEKPAQQEPEPDRVKFERHWRKTRGDKKANRELPRHPLQPQTYIQDSANRHWVTWQAAVRSVSPQPAQQEPVIDKSAAIRIATALGWEPRRELVGLTDGEMRDLEKQFNAERVRTSDEEYLVIYPSDYWAWQRAIEAKLKEKNA